MSARNPFGAPSRVSPGPATRAVQIGPPAKRPRKVADGDSIPFDPERRAASPHLSKAIAELVRFLEDRERILGLRRRSRTDHEGCRFRLAVEAVACNLVVAAMLGQHTSIVVGRGHGAIFGKGRYGSPVYGRHFVDILDLMARPEVSLITAERGYRVSAERRKASTIRALPGLGAHLPLGRLDWSALRSDEDHEVLILKAAKAKGEPDEYLDYPETAETRKLRGEVRHLNRRLAAAPVAVIGTHDSEGRPVDPSRRTLRRIFNNGSWSAGGRLFGGFWMTMPREDRFRLIRIDGEPIANVDYGQLFPRLAYVTAGAEPQTGDLYDIGGDGRHRDGWKVLLNALLFVEGSLTRWPKGASKLFPKGTRLKDCLVQISARHAPIADHFGTGVGFRLMCTESRMLVFVLDRLFRSGIVALPLHDSVLVAGSNAECARTTMLEAARRFTGLRDTVVTINEGEEG